MNWRLAVGRAWRLPVIWAAESDPPEPVTVVHVHYYVPVPGIGLPQPRAAVSTTERRQIGAGKDQ